MSNLLEYAIKPFWIAFAVSGILAYPVFRLLLALKSLQTISQYAPEGHQAKHGTPTMGGLMILPGLVSVLCYSLNVSQLDNQYHKWMVGSIILCLGFGLIGFTDDFLVPRLMVGKRGLGWKQKLVSQLAIALASLWIMGIREPLNITLAAITILFFSNAINFADGLDGLAGSIAVFLALGIGLIGYLWGHSLAPLVCAAMVGAIVPFLACNAPPAKVFMGDVGSLPLGAILGAVVVQLLTGTKATPTTLGPLLLVSALMLVELIPVPLQIFSVKVFKRKLFPFTPIHHAFEKAGWKETRVVWTFAIFQALVSIGAVTWATQSAQDNPPDTAVTRR